MLRLTNSEIATYKRCPRKRWFKYKLLRRVRKVARPLTFGTLVHKCLELYWLARMQGLSLEQAGDAAFKWTEKEENLFDREKAYAMIACYIAIWNQYKGRVLGVEKKFQFPLVNPVTGLSAPRYQMAGKIDLVLQAENGIVELGEHKTTIDEVRPGGGYRQRTRIDAQISGYMIGARAMGYPVARLIYDVLRKPKLKPLLATPVENRIISKKTGKLHAKQRDRDETPAEYGDRILEKMEQSPQDYIVRLECERSDESLRRFYINVWQWAEKIERDDRVGIAPMNEDACWQFETPCEYWEVCTGITTIDNPIRYRDAKTEHEELEDSEEEEREETESDDNEE